MFGVDESWQGWAVLAGVVFGAYLLVIWLAALYWTYRDAASRSRDLAVQIISVGTVLLFNLPGLFVYLIMRPKTTIEERYERHLEARALLQEMNDQPSCPACRRRVDNEFVLCPYCRTTLRVPCDGCGRALSWGWVACPYCGVARQRAPEPAAATGTQPAASSTPQPASPQPATAPPQPRPLRQRRAPTAAFTPPASKPAPAPATAAEPAPDVAP